MCFKTAQAKQKHISSMSMLISVEVNFPESNDMYINFTVSYSN